MAYISAISLLVPDYDVALKFYVGQLGFTLIEDTHLTDDKRWVIVAPPQAGEQACHLLLAKASKPEQKAAIGRQAGGRVFLFLTTDNFRADHKRLTDAGVHFLETPRQEPYGTVAVFKDPFGNLWDLIEPTR